MRERARVKRRRPDEREERAAARPSGATRAAPVPPAHGATVAFIVDRLRDDILAGRLRAGIAVGRMRADRPLRGQPRAGAGGAEAPRRRRADRALAAPRRVGQAPDASARSANCSRSGSKWRRSPPGSPPRPNLRNGAQRFIASIAADLCRRAPPPVRISRGERRLPRRGDGARRQSCSSAIWRRGCNCRSSWPRSATC